MGRNNTHFSAIEQKLLDAGSNQSPIGAEVRGKIDGAFNSGYLMTATVNGKLFRGVLFAPHGLGAFPRGLVLAQNPHLAATQPFPSLAHGEPRFRLFQQPMKNTSPRSAQSFQPTHQMARPFPVVRSTPSLPKEPTPRSDLQGVVLTLGGPGSSQH